MKLRCKYYLFLLIFYFISANCFPQSADDKQRLAGRWVFEKNNNLILVFNSDGSFNAYYGKDREGSGKWEINVIENMLFVTSDNNDSGQINYLISNNGRRLVLIEDGTISVYKKED